MAKHYTFTGVIELVTALHIGSGGGGGSTGTDATVVRDASGRAYIPGSSLRGVLRAAIGAIAPQLGLSEIREDDDIRTGVNAALTNPSRTIPEPDMQRILNDPSALTVAERLFGTVFWASPLHIPDLYQVEIADQSEVRHGVGIDRDTGAARDKAKYDFEVIPKGETFSFFAQLDTSAAPDTHVDEWEQLTALALRLLELQEIRLGGRLARGIGCVQLKDLQVNVLDLSDRGQILDSLKRTTPDQAAGSLKPDWVTSQLDRIENNVQEAA